MRGAHPGHPRGRGPAGDDDHPHGRGAHPEGGGARTSPGSTLAVAELDAGRRRACIGATSRERAERRIRARPGHQPGARPPARRSSPKTRSVNIVVASGPTSVTLGDYTCMNFDKAHEAGRGARARRRRSAAPRPGSRSARTTRTSSPSRTRARARRSSPGAPSRSTPATKNRRRARPEHAVPDGGGRYRGPAMTLAYVHEDFTEDERATLAPFFSDLDGPVFALTNMPEAVKGAMFARYSRTTKSLRRLFLDEFAQDIVAGEHGPDRGQRRRRPGSTSGSSSSTATTRSRSSAACTSRASRRRSCWRRRSSGAGSPPTSSSRRGTCATTTGPAALARDRPARAGGHAARRAVRRLPRRAVRDLRPDVRADRRLLAGARPAGSRRLGLHLPPVDHGEDVRHAARAAARRHPVEPGDLRERPVLRAAADAPGGAPARRDARLRRADARASSGR